jgi:hypothetical protein
MPAMYITTHAVDQFRERVAGFSPEAARAHLEQSALRATHVGVTRRGHALWACGDVCLVAKQDGATTVCVTVLNEEEREALAERPPADPRALRAWEGIMARIEAEEERGAAQERKRIKQLVHEARQAEIARGEEYRLKLRDLLADAYVVLGRSADPAAREVRARIAATVHEKALADAAERASKPSRS